MDEKNKQVKRTRNGVSFPVRMQRELLDEIQEVKPIDTPISEFIRASIRLQIKVLKAERKAS